MSKTREGRRRRRSYIRGGLLALAIILLAPTVLVGLLELMAGAIV